MPIDMMSMMKFYVQSFVDKANRLIERNPGWEPPFDKSHIWAELEATVQYAEDTLEQIKE